MGIVCKISCLQILNNSHNDIFTQLSVFTLNIQTYMPEQWRPQVRLLLKVQFDQNLNLFKF